MPQNSLLIASPTQQQPVQKNRFQLDFPSELSIESWLVESTDRPKININPVDVHTINSKKHVAGKVTYDTITIKFKHHIGISTEQKIMEWIRLHYEAFSGRMGYAFGYKKDLTLKQLDPTGVATSQFIMYGCLITSATFDNNDLSDDGLLMPEITVQPDYVELLY